MAAQLAQYGQFEGDLSPRDGDGFHAKRNGQTLVAAGLGAGIGAWFWLGDSPLSGLAVGVAGIALGVNL